MQKVNIANQKLETIKALSNLLLRYLILPQHKKRAMTAKALGRVGIAHNYVPYGEGKNSFVITDY